MNKKIKKSNQIIIAFYLIKINNKLININALFIKVWYYNTKWDKNSNKLMKSILSKKWEFLT